MTTKQDLIDAIESKGYEARKWWSKEKLQDVLDKIDAQPLPDTSAVVSEKPVNETDTVNVISDTDDSKKEKDPFDELQAKIKAAEAPKDTIKKEKPLFEVTRQKIKKGKMSPDSMQIEGYMLLLVIDTVYPTTFSFLNNMLDKKLKVQAHQLSLKPEQWKSLEPLADQAAAYLAININPVAGLMLMSTFMYGNNLIGLRMSLSSEKK